MHEGLTSLHKALTSMHKLLPCCRKFAACGHCETLGVAYAKYRLKMPDRVRHDKLIGNKKTDPLDRFFAEEL